MTRVTSQRTRQAVLVTGDALDTNELPDKMEFFNELGEPLMLGGGTGRYSADLTTASIAAGTMATGAVDIHASIRLWKIVTSRPARVRLYPSETQRNADASRGLGVRPSSPDSGRVLEVVTTAGMLELMTNPQVDLSTPDPDSSTFYYAVTNMDSSANPVTVTFYYFRTE